MTRANTKLGDVFSIKIDDKFKKYIQYIANDLTQLNSDVIKVFKETYSIKSTPDLSEVVKGDIDFYALSDNFDKFKKEIENKKKVYLKYIGRLYSYFN